MIEIPESLERWQRDTLHRALHAVTVGTISVSIVESLVRMVIEERESRIRQAEDARHIREQLESRIVWLGGGNDRRGMTGDPRQLIVMNGIHPVVEDSR